MSKRTYAIRYRVEPWAAPVHEPTEHVMPGVRTCEEFGYADQLLIASIMRDDDGIIESILLLDSNDCQYPSREVLEEVRDTITHYLEKHCDSN